jgi:2-phospho-L-lactate guanylyltransferase
VLSPEARAAFSLAVLDRVLEAVARTSAVDRLVVVGNSAVVLERAGRFGAEWVHDRRLEPANHARTPVDGALNRAISAGARRAVAGGADAILVIAGDVPLADPDEISALIDGTAPRGVAIVPDRHRNGTNAIVLRPPDVMPVAFGRDSFERHTGIAQDRGLPIAMFDLPLLGLDIDQPGDLTELRSRLITRLAEGRAWSAVSDRELLALVESASSSTRPDQFAEPCGIHR